MVATVAVSGGPLGLALDERLGRLYVAAWFEHRVAVIDTATLQPLGEIRVGQTPSGIAVSPDGRHLLVANRDDNSVMMIDVAGPRIADAAVTATVGVGKAPFGITVSSDGRHLYSADVQSGTVTEVDLAAGRVRRSFKVGDMPYAIAEVPSRRLLFVTNQHASTVSVIDLETGAERSRIAGGPEFGEPRGLYLVECVEHAHLFSAPGRTCGRTRISNSRSTAPPRNRRTM